MGDDSTRHSALKSTTRGASIFSIARIANYGILFLINLVLSRWLGVAGYGIYSYARTSIKFVSNFTDLGTDNALIYFLPKYSNSTSRQEQVFTLSLMSTLLAGFLSSILLYVLAPTISEFTLNSSSFVTALRVFAFILPFQSATKVIQNTFRALDMPLFQLSISQILKPVSSLVSAGVAIGLGYAVEGISFAILVGAILLFLIAVSLFWSRTDLRLQLPRQPREVYEFYNYSVPLTLNSVGFFFTNRLDLLMVGYFLASSSVGIYNIATVLATLVVFPLSGLSQIFPPRASELYNAGEIEELSRFFQTVTRWSLTGAIPIALVTIVYRGELLALFGEEFRAGQLILIIIVLARLINAATGPCGYLLMMSGHQYLTTVDNWILGSTNAVLNVVLINQFGLIGAAVATTTSVILFNSLQIVQLWYLEGFLAYSTKAYKPIVSGVLCGGLMFVVSVLLNGLAAIVVGGGLGVAVFVILLLWLGIEDIDHELIETVLQ